MNASGNDSHGARRLAVILGGGDADTRALGILASVLREFSPEVAGLFLEDVDLFRLAQLPFSCEISRLTSRAQPLTTIELEREVRVQAVRAERALRVTAERAGLKWSFQRMRGRLNMALEAAPNVNLLLLSATRRNIISSGEAGALGRALRASEGEPTRPIVAVFDGSDPATVALQSAIRLSRSTNRRLEVILVAATTDAAAELRGRAVQLLAPQTATLRRVPDMAIETLTDAIRAHAPALLVIGANKLFLESPGVGLLRRSIDCPALIVR
ncbi:MAG: universal stress protein [Myxococcales bacterium]|nr:universal stress protein [Myxococcales bacterium]MDH3483251.1 universal stress protein [Myxococcales bacterium]